VAWTRSAETRAAAAAAGVDVQDTLAEVVEAADVVVLAPPLPALADVVDQVAAVVNGGDRSPTITDVGSVKAPIAAHAAKVLDDPGAFVPGHPLAGSERSGWASADAGLFAGTTWALVVDEPTDLDRWFALAGWLCGLGVQVVPVGADEHDRVLALTSHLPYLLGGLFAARLRSPEGALAAALSGGSLASLTRVVTTADGARFGAELTAANREAVLVEIDGLVSALAAAGDALRSDDPASVAGCIASVPEVAVGPPVVIGPMHRDELRGLGHRGARITAVEGDRLTVVEPT
jgi:prephenate dehydrogenase